MKVPPEDLLRESWDYFYTVVCAFIEDWGTAAALLARGSIKREIYELTMGVLDGFAAYIRRMAMIDLADRGEELARRKPTKPRKSKAKPRVLAPIDPGDPLTWRNLRFDWKLPGAKKKRARPAALSSPRAAKKPQLDVCDTQPIARKLERICRIMRNPEAALRRLARKVFDREQWILAIAQPKPETPHARINNAGIDVLFRRRFPHLLAKSIWDPG